MVKLRIIEGPMEGQDFELDEDIFFVGRSTKNDLQLTDSAVSRMHLKVFKLGKACFVEDLKSSNGTFINDKTAAPGEGFQVEVGDVVSIGNTKIRFEEIPTKAPFDLKELGTPKPERVKSGETDRSVERRARSGREFKLIESVSELLRESTDTRDFLNEVVGFLAEILPRIDRAAIFLFDSETLETKDVISQPRQDAAKGFMPFSREALDRVLKEMKAVMVQDATLEKPVLSATEGDSAGIKSFMCVPVTAKSKLHGAIYVDGIKETHAFRKDDFSLVNCLTGPLGLAIENAQLTAKLSSIAGILSST